MSTPVRRPGWLGSALALHLALRPLGALERLRFVSDVALVHTHVTAEELAGRLGGGGHAAAARDSADGDIETVVGALLTALREG